MIAAQIHPFKMIIGETSSSIILNVGQYCDEIFAEREQDGFLGNGYDWGALAAVFIAECKPELEDDINFDSEADMFCAYSENHAALENFAVQFHAMTQNTDQMRDLLSRAELD